MNEKEIKYYELFVPVEVEQANKAIFDRVLGFTPLILEAAAESRLEVVFKQEGDESGVAGISFTDNDGKLEVALNAGDNSRQYVIDAYNATIQFNKLADEKKQIDLKDPIAQAALADLESALIAGETAIVRKANNHDEAE